MQDTPTFHSLHALGALIRQIRGLPDAERFDALSSACLTLGGTVIQPGSSGHLHEASVLGVYAGADDRQELVTNWLRGARAPCGALADFVDVADNQPSPIAVDYHPNSRGRQLAAAAATIARPDRHDDSDLISACRIILAHSRDHSERDRACQLAASLGHGTPGEGSA